MFTNLINKLKEKRFTTTARVLGEKKAIGVNVKIVSQSNGGAAWWESQNKLIVLNDAMPATTDSKLTLIWERAKLFHELFHVLFTTHETLRQDYFYKANNRDRYLWVSNALEDGRIEYHGGKMFAGCTWYIHTLLQYLVKTDSTDSGLLIYVRTKLWRNAKEKAFWAKYQGLIDECITAKSSDIVWKNAFDIVQDMEKPQPKQNPPPQGKPEQSDDEGEQDSEGNPQSDEGESDETESEESESGEGESNDDGSQSDDEGKSESETDSGSDNDEPADDVEDDEGNSEGGSGGQGTNEAGDTADEQETPSEPPTGKQAMDNEVRKAIEKLLKESMEQIADEVDSELIEIDREAADYVCEQEYINSQESQIADQLTEIFASILVDSKRQRFQSCKRGGTLDTKRLLETRTGGEYMHERVDKASQPHIALLIDLSFSMDHQRRELTQAARILHGAIHASGAIGATMTFGAYDDTNTNKVDSYSIVPEIFDSGFSTPTDAGLFAARQWLNQEQAKRGMVIVITDGEPNNKTKTAAQFQELSNEGWYVLNVLLGASAGMVQVMQSMCHNYVCVKDATELVQGLEEPIANFMSGAF